MSKLPFLGGAQMVQTTLAQVRVVFSHTGTLTLSPVYTTVSRHSHLASKSTLASEP